MINYLYESLNFKKEIIEVLPSIIKLSHTVVREVFSRLLGINLDYFTFKNLTFNVF